MGDIISIRCARGPALVRAAIVLLLAPILLAGWGCSRHPARPVAAEAAASLAKADAPAPELAGGPETAESAAQPAELAQAVEAAPAPVVAEPVDLAPKGMPDPLQPLNRRMFQADRAIADFVTEKTPVGRMIDGAPSPARAVVINAVLNLDEPRAVANRVLQRKPGRALRAAARFLINSTAGIGGLIDVAKKLGLERSRTNFGQTLASYGVRPGAYVYVPVLGPSNVRDVFGTAVDSYFWPVHWLSVGELPRQAMGVARVALTRTQRAKDLRARGAGRPYQERYLIVRQAYAEAQLPAPASGPIEAARAKYPPGADAQAASPVAGAAIIASASR